MYDPESRKKALIIVELERVTSPILLIGGI